MKARELLAEILNAVVRHERDKVVTQKPEYYLNQKKQLWYGLMSRIDEEKDGEGSDDS